MPRLVRSVGEMLTFVTGRDGVVSVVWVLSTPNDVPPPCPDASTSRNVNDIAVPEYNIPIACEIGIADVCNGLFNGNSYS